MSSEGLLVEHVQATASLVITSSLSSPGFVSINGGELGWLIGSIKCFAEGQYLNVVTKLALFSR